MPTDRGLTTALDELAERVLPDQQLTFQRALQAAINPDGSINIPALTNERRHERWYLAGPLVAGSNVEGEIVWPQTSAARSLHASVKVAPVGSELTAEVEADGSVIAKVTVQPGQTSNTSPLFNVTIAAGAVVRLNLTAVGSTTPAESLSLTLAYSPA